MSFRAAQTLRLLIETFVVVVGSFGAGELVCVESARGTVVAFGAEVSWPFASLQAVELLRALCALVGCRELVARCVSSRRAWKVLLMLCACRAVMSWETLLKWISVFIRAWFTREFLRAC